MLKDKLNKKKLYVRIVKYSPIILELYGIIKCILSFLGVMAIGFEITFGIPLLPAIILLAVMNCLGMCLCNKLSILYSFLTFSLLNLGIKYSFLFLPELLLCLFIIGLLLLTITLIYYFNKN